MGRTPFLKCSLAAAVSAVAVAGLSSQARADVVPFYETIALTGQDAPGTLLVYRGFDSPTINSAGQVAWYGAYGESTGGLLSNGIWTGLPGDIHAVALIGGEAPGTDTGSGLLTYEGFGGARVGLADTGDVIFTATLNDDANPNANTDRGIWIGTVNSETNTLALLVREGDPVPDVDPNNPPFGDNAEPVFNNNLGLAVIGRGGIGGFSSPITDDVDNSLNEHSLFAGTAAPDGLHAIALAGTPVFGEPANVLYAGAATTPRLNTFGQSAFAAGLKGSETGTAIFVGAPGDAAVLAAQGRAAPGFSGGETFDAIQFPDLNDSGNVVFVAAVNGFEGDINPFQGEAIYFGNATSGITPIALIGDPVAGTTGDTYAEFVNVYGPMLNDAGEVTFVALLEGASTNQDNNLAVMVGDTLDPATLHIVAREGVTLDQNGQLFPIGASLQDSPLINNSGDVAFHISESDGSTSLWLAAHTGELVRIVGSGDVFAVADGDTRTVAALKMGTNIDGYQYLSDNGSVIFGLLFTDGSEGVFASGIVIPEPSGIAIALGAGALLLRRRRR